MKKRFEVDRSLSTNWSATYLDNGKQLSTNDTCNLLNTMHEELEALHAGTPPAPVPFDHERALAGDAVITQDGREVTELHFFETYDGDCPWVGVIDGRIRSFTKEGRYFPNGGESPFDLFMKPKGQFVYVAEHINGSVSVFYSDPSDLHAYRKTHKIWLPE